jgi:putative membrane protein
VAAGTWQAVNVGIILVHIVLLLYAYWLIRVRRDIPRHRRTMIGAGIVFLIFLASFIVRIILRGVTPLGTWSFVLQPHHLQLAHAGVAVVTVAVVATTYYFGLTKRYVQHRRIARWAICLWIFTGLYGIFGFLFYPRA